MARQTYPILHDRAALLALAEAHRYRSIAMATAIGCGRWSVSAAFRAHGIVNPYHKPHRRCPELRDRAWLEQRYFHDGRSMEQIAQDLGCSRWPVDQALKRFQIPRRSARTPTGSQVPRLNDPA